LYGNNVHCEGHRPLKQHDPKGRLDDGNADQKAETHAAAKNKKANLLRCAKRLAGVKTIWERQVTKEIRTVIAC